MWTPLQDATDAVLLALMFQTGDAVEIARFVEGQAMMLDTPERLGQTLHDRVLDLMRIAESGEQALIAIADAARLIEAELFEDGQMQPQMQEGVGPAQLGRKVLVERALAALQERPIFRMTAHELDELGFERLQRLLGIGLAPGFEKDPAVCLSVGTEHGLGRWMGLSWMGSCPDSRTGRR